MPKTEISMNRNTKTFLFLHCMVINIIYWVFLFSTGWFLSPHWKNTVWARDDLCVSFAFLFVFCASLCLLCSRKPSFKEKGSPSKCPGGKEAKTPKPEEGVKESPSKVTKSLSFTAKQAFRMKDGASRQNSEGQRMLLCTHTQEYWNTHSVSECCFQTHIHLYITILALHRFLILFFYTRLQQLARIVSNFLAQNQMPHWIA